MKRNLTIVGCGPGDKDFITRTALTRINEADVVIGSQRLLEMFKDVSAEKVNIGSNYNELTKNILSMKEKKITVLVSGDPGFFSLAKILVRKIGIDNCEIIPGISSVQLAFARIGENWNDAKFLSLHGRDQELINLVEAVLQNDKVAILTDEKNNPSVIANVLAKNNITNRKAFIFENVSLDHEKIHTLNIKSMCDVKTGGMNIVILLKE